MQGQHDRHRAAVGLAVTLDRARSVMSASTTRLILASTSPRRAQLLREHGYEFTVVPSAPDHPTPPSGAPPWQTAQRISREKAESVTATVTQGVIIAADTVVALGNDVHGTPIDRDDARRILTALAGSTHEVITAITLIRMPGHAVYTDHDVTRVRMRPMSSAEMEAHLDGGDWRGKAGAYGIQDTNDAFVERMEGSYSNVVGLPLELLARMLAELDRSGG